VGSDGKYWYRGIWYDPEFVRQADPVIVMSVLREERDKLSQWLQAQSEWASAVRMHLPPCDRYAFDARSRSMRDEACRAYERWRAWIENVRAE
jgi:hypothetical protein